jgi:hypothetical protein
MKSLRPKIQRKKHTRAATQADRYRRTRQENPARFTVTNATENQDQDSAIDTETLVNSLLHEESTRENETEKTKRGRAKGAKGEPPPGSR